MAKSKLSKKYYRNFLFLISIIATIAYRSIVILNHYSQQWVEIAWYIGTIGFVWYFAHRYRVANVREKLVTEKKLDEKVRNNEPLTSEERESVAYILKGLGSSKAKWSYIVIFLFSAIAFVYAIIMNIITWLG